MKNQWIVCLSLFFLIHFSLVSHLIAFQKEPLFEDQTPLEMEIVTNLKALRQTKSDTVFFSTFLKFSMENGTIDSLPVELRARANTQQM
ncbi:hypothetical protein [Mongoliibacter ruber]|uniref:Uncharacterized protein n=1 Tax=Mongoliibacter ruber TaxID=1750599 RepID=A0A2T0WHW2_9BACT|nr:hypothetical protein [Mongoliibacter ruber]PRY86303.1 hypothetical protein CLW00_109150 [Mongoliibacter ruber]